MKTLNSGIGIGDRVLPRDNHRHGTVTGWYECFGEDPRLWVRCDCGHMAHYAVRDLQATPGAPPDIQAVGPNRGHGGGRGE